MKNASEAVPARPDDISMAGAEGQTDVEIITLLRDRQLAKVAVIETRAAKNMAALRRDGTNRVHGDARKILKEGLDVADAEVPRLMRLAEALNRVLAKLASANKK